MLPTRALPAVCIKLEHRRCSFIIHSPDTQHSHELDTPHASASVRLYFTQSVPAPHRGRYDACFRHLPARRRAFAVRLRPGRWGWPSRSVCHHLRRILRHGECQSTRPCATPFTSACHFSGLPKSGPAARYASHAHPHPLPHDRGRAKTRRAIKCCVTNTSPYTLTVAACAASKRESPYALVRKPF